jgi:hypothetical protein
MIAPTRSLIAFVLLTACSDGTPSVERDPSNAVAEDAETPGADAARRADASGIPIGQRDGAVLPATVDGAVAMPDVAPYPACGGFARLSCHDGEFCSFEQAPDQLGCGSADSLGTCANKPELCVELSEPVCGCDGKTYANRCAAHAAGVSIAAVHPCKPARPASCDEGDVLCKRVRPECPPGQVPAVVDSCWGDCMDISLCVCHAADECPQREQYVCFMSAQHCGPYVD